MNNLNFKSDIAKVIYKESFPEQRLASQTTQPLTGMCSGNRKLMHTVHDSHTIPLKTPEMERLSSGFERKNAKMSSEYILSPDEFEVLKIIDKFESKPGLNRWFIVRNLTGKTQPKGLIDVIERAEYSHLSESYGSPRNNAFIDSLQEGSLIHTGDIIRCPEFINQYGNPESGVNLLTGFLSNNWTQQDGVVLSESAAKKMESMLYKKLFIKINSNDILLNIYGDSKTYKVIPDIGEDIKDSILCSIRRQNNAETLFSHSWERLRIPTIDDEKYTLNGKVIDLDILVNEEDKFMNSIYHDQLRYYHFNKIRYCSEFINVINQLKLRDDFVGLSNDLSFLYDRSMAIVNRIPYANDGKVFSGNILELVIKEDLPIKVGDKMTNRFGGKGVVIKIIPDELMPRLKDGRIIEIENNNATVVGRQNSGVLMEMELNNRSSQFIRYLDNLGMDDDFVADHIYRFYKILSPISLREKYKMNHTEELGNYNEARASMLTDKTLADRFIETYRALDDYNKHLFIQDYFEQGFIYLTLLPLSDVITIDTLIQLDKEFPWLEPEYIYAPITNSMGQTRYVKSLRPVVVGEVYYVRLKQYAKDKFSATSNSTVNLRNENSKSTANKLYKEPHADTPVRMGTMETEDLQHIGVSKVIIFMLLYSHSVSAKRNVRKLYNSDPIDFNILLDKDATSRGAEINATYAKFLGYRHVFKKKLKEYKKPPFTINAYREAPFHIKQILKEVPFTINDSSETMIVKAIDEKGKIVDVPKNAKDMKMMKFKVTLDETENGINVNIAKK